MHSLALKGYNGIAWDYNGNRCYCKSGSTLSNNNIAGVIGLTTGNCTALASQLPIGAACQSVTYTAAGVCVSLDGTPCWTYICKDSKALACDAAGNSKAW